MEKIIAFLAVYLPFQLAINPTAGVDLASIRVLVILVFFLWLAQGLKKKQMEIPVNLKLFFLSFFLLLSLVSFLVSQNHDWSVRKMVYLISIFPIYLVVSSLIKKNEVQIKLIKILVIGGGLVALLGVFQFLGQFYLGKDKIYTLWAEKIAPPFLGKSVTQAVLENPSWLVNISGETYLRATASFPDPHMLSFFLGLLFPLALGLGFFERRKKMLWFILAGVILIADILTFSRGGYLGLIGGLIFFLFFLWKKLGWTGKKIVAVSILGFLLAIFYPSPISQRLQSSFDLKEGSNKGRLSIWEDSGKIIADNPLLGVGLGNYALAIKPLATYREPIYAHNTYLDIAAETGILNALIWILFLWVVIRDFMKKSLNNPIFMAGAVGIIIFSIHSVVETAIYSPVVLCLFLIISALSNYQKDEKIS